MLVKLTDKINVNIDSISSTNEGVDRHGEPYLAIYLTGSEAVPWVTGAENIKRVKQILKTVTYASANRLATQAYYTKDEFDRVRNKYNESKEESGETNVAK